MNTTNYTRDSDERSSLGRQRTRAMSEPSQNDTRRRDGDDDDNLWSEEPSNTKAARSVTDKLIDLVADVELFHAPDGDAYASVPVREHHRTLRVSSTEFRNWLRQRYYHRYGGAATGQPVKDAIDNIAARAQFNAPQEDIYVRVAGHGDAIYIDLGNDAWEAVEIRSEGWRIVSNPPVRFRRPHSMLALPTPIRGGTLDELRDHLNADDDGWVLLVSWLVMACRPNGPYPVLNLTGEQGTAKSTTGKVLRSLLDPSRLDLRSEPRDTRDLMIAATNGWTIAFDNLSYVKPDLSDALCRLSTGGGTSTRRLYTDGEEIIFEAMRPLILTGIGDLATRNDLIDRSLMVTLLPIPEHRRVTEKVFWHRFDEAAPRILGALYDAVSTALRNADSTTLSDLPRMADFALWVCAAEERLPWASGSFLPVLRQNRQDAISVSVESDPVPNAVKQLIEDCGAWTGTATELLNTLEPIAGERTVRSRGWPKSSSALSNRLQRSATALRTMGIDVTRDRGSNARIITIQRIMQTPSSSSPPTNKVVDTSERGGDEREASMRERSSLPADLVEHFARDISSAFDRRVPIDQQDVARLLSLAEGDTVLLDAAITVAADDLGWDLVHEPPVDYLDTLLREREADNIMAEAVRLHSKPDTRNSPPDSVPDDDWDEWDSGPGKSWTDDGWDDV